MALFTRTAKLDPGDHGARCAWAMAVHHAVGISRIRNSGYRPSSVNIMAQGFSAPDPSLSPTDLSIRRGRATTTHYTHHQVSLMVSRNTTLVPSLGLCIGPAVRQASALACEGSVCHPKGERKKEWMIWYDLEPICERPYWTWYEIELTVAIWASVRVTWSVYWHLLTSRSVHLPGLTQRYLAVAVTLFLCGCSDAGPAIHGSW